MERGVGGGGPISAANLDCGFHISRNPRSEGIPYLQETWFGGSHICRKPGWGDPISTENLHGGRGNPMSAGNLDGGRDLISAGNLDWGSHTCRKPRWVLIPNLQ